MQHREHTRHTNESGVASSDDQRVLLGSLEPMETKRYSMFQICRPHLNLFFLPGICRACMPNYRIQTISKDVKERVLWLIQHN